ncbi:MAG: energy-coupling factor transporter transmembrane protein EcfT [Clostridia bacterium]|nr:energy-coupling factor transporter transmembrane protein EcfT [Clostridia bacterium]
MKSRDTFSFCHPTVNFLYFGLVLLFTMCFVHPLARFVSLAGALAYDLYLNGRKAAGFTLKYMLPMLLLTAIINPAFSHEGVTILWYFPNGNPLTLESILFGAAAALMLVAVVLWFGCYNTVMTSDKFVYLFGRVIPALSLVLSMTLRFVPKFQAQLRAVSESQRCVGRDIRNGTLLQRFRHGITILSILLTWVLENAIETADSMRGRGYGLPGRTAYSIYRFDDRDRCVLLWLAFCGVTIIGAWIAKGFYWNWYPRIRYTPFLPIVVFFHLVYFALCFTPLIMDLYADYRWEKTQKGEL